MTDEGRSSTPDEADAGAVVSQHGTMNVGTGGSSDGRAPCGDSARRLAITPEIGARGFESHPPVSTLGRSQRVLAADVQWHCGQAGQGGCEGPVDEVEGDYEDTVEWMCRYHQSVYGQGHYSDSGVGWPR